MVSVREPKTVRGGDYRRLALIICAALGFAGLAVTVVLVSMRAPTVAVARLPG